jgi:hypothetical protein
MKHNQQVRVAVTALAMLVAFVVPSFAAEAGSTWTFGFSGDSRNCGDIVMPAIAADAAKNEAKFFWHLGDMRAMYDFDADMTRRPDRIASGNTLSIADYQATAWQDFIDNQIAPFRKVPVYLGIGNHELVPPKTRTDFVIQFADWLDTPVLRDQRLKDDPADHKLKTYFHWIQGGVDFIYLDNASADQFDGDQMKWFEAVLRRAQADPAVKAVVLGTHAALPYSLAAGHSMNDYPQGEKSGVRVYSDLLKFQNESKKRAYIVSSHSHFYMAGVYNTPYWREHGGVIPGWIIGTAGAFRYKLPADAAQASEAKTNTYGYLLGTVHPDGTISVGFREMQQQDVPQSTLTKYGTELVRYCFVENHQ